MQQPQPQPQEEITTTPTEEKILYEGELNFIPIKEIKKRSSDGGSVCGNKQRYLTTTVIEEESIYLFGMKKQQKQQQQIEEEEHHIVNNNNNNSNNNCIKIIAKLILEKNEIHKKYECITRELEIQDEAWEWAKYEVIEGKIIENITESESSSSSSSLLSFQEQSHPQQSPYITPPTTTSSNQPQTKQPQNNINNLYSLSIIIELIPNIEEGLGIRCMNFETGEWCNDILHLGWRFLNAKIVVSLNGGYEWGLTTTEKEFFSTSNSTFLFKKEEENKDNYSEPQPQPQPHHKLFNNFYYCKFLLLANGEKGESINIAEVEVIFDYRGMIKEVKESHHNHEHEHHFHKHNLEEEQKEIIINNNNNDNNENNKNKNNNNIHNNNIHHHNNNKIKFNYVKELKLFRNFSILGAVIAEPSHLIMIGNSNSFNEEELAHKQYYQPCRIKINLNDINNPNPNPVEFKRLTNFIKTTELHQQHQNCNYESSSSSYVVMIRQYLGEIDNDMVFIVENNNGEMFIHKVSCYDNVGGGDENKRNKRKISNNNLNKRKFSSSEETTTPTPTSNIKFVRTKSNSNSHTTSRKLLLTTQQQLQEETIYEEEENIKQTKEEQHCCNNETITEIIIDSAFNKSQQHYNNNLTTTTSSTTLSSLTKNIRINYYDKMNIISYELICEQFFEKIKDSPSVIRFNIYEVIPKNVYYVYFMKWLFKSSLNKGNKVNKSFIENVENNENNFIAIDDDNNVVVEDENIILEHEQEQHKQEQQHYEQRQEEEEIKNTYNELIKEVISLMF